MRRAAFDPLDAGRWIVTRLRAEIGDAAARHNALAIALMGSVARGDDGAGSDYDFLVDFDRGVTLFDMGGLKADLEDLLGAEVDVVPRSCLRDRYYAMLADILATCSRFAEIVEPRRGEFDQNWLTVSATS